MKKHFLPKTVERLLSIIFALGAPFTTTKNNCEAYLRLRYELVKFCAKSHGCGLRKQQVSAPNEMHTYKNYFLATFKTRLRGFFVHKKALDIIRSRA